ncbi:BnaC04g51020D [Brassica napus]|uniref:BnaC04g51020D protein n=1 Tax=Brassica napus TaxID=3708 RepID=A0A078GQ78_BRANA|nr:BnaC04g51020D [Brassica napus]
MSSVLNRYNTNRISQSRAALPFS